MSIWILQPLIDHNNEVALSVDATPLDLGAFAPVAPLATDGPGRDPSADCKTCGGRSYVVTDGAAYECHGCTEEDDLL